MFSLIIILMRLNLDTYIIFFNTQVQSFIPDMCMYIIYIRDRSPSLVYYILMPASCCSPVLSENWILTLILACQGFIHCRDHYMYTCSGCKNVPRCCVTSSCTRMCLRLKKTIFINKVCTSSFHRFWPVTENGNRQ